MGTVHLVTLTFLQFSKISLQITVFRHFVAHFYALGLCKTLLAQAFAGHVLGQNLLLHHTFGVVVNGIFGRVLLFVIKALNAGLQA